MRELSKILFIGFLSFYSSPAHCDYLPYKQQFAALGIDVGLTPAGTPENFEGALWEFRCKIGSSYSGALHADELVALYDGEVGLAHQQALDRLADDPAMQRKLIIAGALDAIVGSVPAKAFRDAVQHFRHGTNRERVGRLTAGEMAELDQIERDFDTFAGFKTIDGKISGLNVRLPAALVEATPEPKSNKPTWTTYSSTNGAIKVHLFNHSPKANTPLSLATSLIPDTDVSPRIWRQFHFLQVTREDFVIESVNRIPMPEKNEPKEFMNNAVGWDRNGRVFGLKVTANLDPIPDVAAAAPQLPDYERSSTDTAEDLKARNWSKITRALWNITVSDYMPLNRWERISAATCEKKRGAGGRWIPVVYATDRKSAPTVADAVRPASDQLYTTERDDALHVGCALVWVPDSAKYQASLEQLIGRGAPGSPTNDPSKNFDVEAREFTRPLASGEDRDLNLVDPLKNRSQKALFFIHGYNSSFSDAILRAAQIAAAVDYDGRVYAFSWPSQENRFSYIGDMDFAEQAELDLQYFIKMVLRDASELDVDIIAHSMGAQLLLRSVNNLLSVFDRREGDERNDRIRLRQIIFAAPDVSELVFRRKVAQLSGNAQRVTLYASANDGPLSISRLLRGRVPRAGAVVNGLPIKVSNVDVIDITGKKLFILNPNRYFGTYHSAFAYEPEVLRDIQSVLQRGRSPTVRARMDNAEGRFEERYYDNADKTSRSKYWVLQSTPILNSGEPMTGSLPGK